MPKTGGFWLSRKFDCGVFRWKMTVVSLGASIE